MIYEAIADGDSERARLRAAAHILGVEDAVRAMAAPPALKSESVRFAHASERQFAQLLDFYQI